MTTIVDLICHRRSVRTFDGRPISDAHLDQLRAAMETAKNPYGIPVEFRLLHAAEHKLTSPVLSGEDLYVGAKLPRVPHFEEALGYSLEHFLLSAEALGIGTVWLGGTMGRANFEKAMELSADEVMPCVSPLGYPALRMSLKETLMRKTIKADSRLPFDALFFRDSFETPLTDAGDLQLPLEAVRLAPSAVNRQPWRAVVTENAVHFYKKGKVPPTASTGDMQKIDLGIALCHFRLAAEEAGISAEFVLRDPMLSTPENTEYIASYLLG